RSTSRQDQRTPQSHNASFHASSFKLLLRNLAQSLHPAVAIVKGTQKFQAGVGRWPAPREPRLCQRRAHILATEGFKTDYEFATRPFERVPCRKFQQEPDVRLASLKCRQPVLVRCVSRNRDVIFFLRYCERSEAACTNSICLLSKPVTVLLWRWSRSA